MANVISVNIKDLPVIIQSGKIRLEPRAEGDNELLFASSTVFPIHHSLGVQEE